MIYISSACFKAKTIRESVTFLAEAGFKNIELSGGTKYYPEYEIDLLRLQDRYELNYQVHNYFPPPETPFVLNLASVDDKIREQSIQLCKNAITLSKKLRGSRYGIHAGFLIDIKPREAGKKIARRELSNRNKALSKFAEGWQLITDEAADDVDLYIENNVISSTNTKSYSGTNPFLLTDYSGYLELKEHVDFKLLLDLAHLKVSAKSLELGFNDELEKLLPLSDFIHLSDNDGLHDQNRPISPNSMLLKKLQGFYLKDKLITIEVYDEIENILTSYEAITSLVDSNN